MADVVKNDTNTILQLTLYDQSDQIIDLTGASVVLIYYIDFYPPFSTKTMTIASNPTTGMVSYQFAVNNLVTPNIYDLYADGVLYYMVRITFADGTILSSPFIGEITVHPAITA